MRVELRRNQHHHFHPFPFPPFGIEIFIKMNASDFSWLLDSRAECVYAPLPTRSKQQKHPYSHTPIPPPLTTISIYHNPTSLPPSPHTKITDIEYKEKRREEDIRRDEVTKYGVQHLKFKKLEN